MSGLPDFQVPWQDRYMPHQPTSKQLAFLLLPHEEAFFGGAAGGGKSDALLMAALQYAHVPNYSAIIFRRTFRDLSLPEALIPRAHEWLGTTDAKWNSQQYEWTFPSGAKLTFGYMDSVNDKYRYQGAAFQFVAFDELTQFREEDFTYLFSRLRRTKKIQLSGVPLRVRTASNPGGVGHTWVKRRYRIVLNQDGEMNRFVGTHPERPYIPAFVKDNPYLDQEAYEESLEKLGHVEKMQLLHGDWAVVDQARFLRDWTRYWSEQSDWYILGPDRTGKVIRKDECDYYMCIDPAVSVRDRLGTSTGRAESHSVIGVFARHVESGNILWVDNWREQVEAPQLVDAVEDLYGRWKPSYIVCEATGVGRPILQRMQDMGLPVRKLEATQDKVSRSVTAQILMKNGKIWLPRHALWSEDMEDEIFTWTGDKDEPDDQVDVLSMAAREAYQVSRQRTTYTGIPISVGGRERIDQSYADGVPGFLGGRGAGFG